jgi:hypothetical protein
MFLALVHAIFVESGGRAVDRVSVGGIELGDSTVVKVSTSPARLSGQEVAHPIERIVILPSVIVAVIALWYMLVRVRKNLSCTTLTTSLK